MKNHRREGKRELPLNLGAKEIYSVGSRGYPPRFNYHPVPVLGVPARRGQPHFSTLFFFFFFLLPSRLPEVNLVTSPAWTKSAIRSLIRHFPMPKEERIGNDWRGWKWDCRRKGNEEREGISWWFQVASRIIAKLIRFDDRDFDILYCFLLFLSLIHRDHQGLMCAG